MPVVARAVIKIIRELRAAANDTISEIRQSLEELPPEREQWVPPSHDEGHAGIEAQPNADDPAHSADTAASTHQRGPEPDQSPLHLDGSVTYRSFEGRQELGNSPAAENPREHEQEWETEEVAKPQQATPVGDSPQVSAGAEDHTSVAPTSADQEHQTSESPTPAQSAGVPNGDTPAQGNSSGLAQALPEGPAQAREETTSPGVDEPARVSGKSPLQSTQS